MRDASARLKKTHPHNVLDTGLGFGQQAGLPFPATDNPQCGSLVCVCGANVLAPYLQDTLE